MKMAFITKSFLLLTFCMVAIKFGESCQKRAKYTKKTLSQQVMGLTFRKIEGRKARAECAVRCSKYNACRSFYVDDGACVFGLRDDVTEFANGDGVTPVDGQMLMTKRKQFITQIFSNVKTNGINNLISVLFYS